MGQQVWCRPGAYRRLPLGCLTKPKSPNCLPGNSERTRAFSAFHLQAWGTWQLGTMAFVLCFCLGGGLFFCLFELATVCGTWIKPRSPALEAGSLNYWITREVLRTTGFGHQFEGCFVWLLLTTPPPSETHTCTHTCTHTIDLSFLCAEELNYVQMRTAVRWSPAQVGKSWKAL